MREGDLLVVYLYRACLFVINDLDTSFVFCYSDCWIWNVYTFLFEYLFGFNR